MTFVRPLGMILPSAEATISMVPNDAQMSATQKSAIMAAPIAPASGGGGDSMISKAAGKKARSAFPRDVAVRKNGHVASANFMNARLQTMQRRIAPAGIN